MSLYPAAAPAAPRSTDARLVAVLGPTNTGKTFLAIERMVAHSSGTIGLPLRLLAREVYSRVCERVGAAHVSLVTGEEKITPPHARYSVCTVEAMPRKPGTAFVAIDEVQLAADLERGHIFTDRILNARGYEETMLLGSGTMAGVLAKLLPGIQTTTRPRLSHLAYSGQKKITRLPRRTAIVAFTANEVYAIAELIRRQRGGAAVVLGALSPRTRNAQVELYQNGEVDFLVATDAIGMGLNLDVDHVAFAQDWKYDGFQFRQLTPAEYGQIAGRAGRHLRDGTFGVTGQVDPLPGELVEALEGHSFAPVRVLQWRSSNFDFSSVDALKASLDTAPPQGELAKALPAVDQRALDFLSREPDIMDKATSPRTVELLWEACKLPDYRRIAPAQHAEIIATIYADLAVKGKVAEDYMATQVRRADRTDGEIDTLSQRIAEIRTWTYISHRPGWLADPTHWQEKTRDIENRLSDALHERLTKRFVDRRTSVLMRRLRENAFMEAEIGSDGTVMVEGHAVGELQGFRFTIDTSAEGQDGKAVRAASQKALAGEFEKRAERFANAPNGDFALGSDGLIRWLGAPVAVLAGSDDPLKPRVVLLADDQLTGPARDKVVARIERFIAYQITTLLKPLVELKDGEGLEGAAKGIAFQLYENFGLLQRREVSETVRGLDQQSRAALRRLGVRFGAYHIFVPALIKPAPAGLVTLLFAVHKDAKDRPGYGEVPGLLATGRTSAVADTSFDPVFYGLAGYRLLGRRAVRIDILERLADLIRPALSWKPGEGKRPEGGYNGGQFLVTPPMMSILGATAEDMEEILKGLGYRAEPKDLTSVEAEIARYDAEAQAKIEADRAVALAAAAEKAAAAQGEAESAASAETDAAPSVETAGESPSDETSTAEVGGESGDEAAPAETAAASVSETAMDAPAGDEPVDAEAATTAEMPEASVTPAAGETSGASPASDETHSEAAPASETAASSSETTTLEAAAETPSDEAPVMPDAEASIPTEPEEPKTVLVWRQNRSERGGRGQRHGGQRYGGERHRQGGAPADRRGNEGERPARSAEGGERPPRHQHGKPGQKPFNKGGGKKRFDKDRDERQDDRRFANKGPQGGGRPHGGGGGAGNPKPQRIDPDSPFAKLAQLKDKLGK